MVLIHCCCRDIILARAWEHHGDADSCYKIEILIAGAHIICYIDCFSLLPWRAPLLAFAISLRHLPLTFHYALTPFSPLTTFHFDWSLLREHWRYCHYAIIFAEIGLLICYAIIISSSMPCWRHATIAITFITRYYVSAAIIFITHIIAAIDDSITPLLPLIIYYFDVDTPLFSLLHYAPYLRHYFHAYYFMPCHYAICDY